MLKKLILPLSILAMSLSVSANDTEAFTDTDYTGLRIYHHMENMVEHIETIGLNTWDHPAIADHTFFVITPALDHLYSKAMIDLRNGPVILDTPPRDDRYSSLQLVDAEHFTVYAETTPQAGGKFLITRAGADYKLPEGDFTDIIEVKDDLMFVFIRTQTLNYTDKGFANENRHQLKLTPIVANFFLYGYF